MPYTVSFVNVSPIGAAQQLYFLRVTWTDPTDPSAIGVNVYRSTVSGGPYTLITSTPVPVGVQLYDDFNILTRVVYFYVTTEVNNVGAESSFSTEQNGEAGLT